MSSDLTKYIDTLREKGVPDGKIRDKLVAAGWDSTEVSNTLHHAPDDGLPPPPPPPSTPPTQSSESTKKAGYANMWEGFEHV